MTADDTVRAYMTALKDPESLRDDAAIEEVTAQLERTDDPLERLELHERLRRLAEPAISGVEDAFVESAKEWAAGRGITAQAFIAEGVPADVLRRAGFEVGRGRSSTRRSGRGTTRRASSGKRVTTEQVIDAMPKGTFTVKQLQDASGASPAVVRKAIRSELEAGRLTDAGADPDHSGPGRAATLYRRKKR